MVLINGWPLSHEAWSYQLGELPKHGIRAIAYTCRGFGNSSKSFKGYDYDTLNLQKVSLVGHSMGGGEVARYMSRHGGARVDKFAFVSSVMPYLLKTANNPDGVDKSTFDDIRANLVKDRCAFLQPFGKQFYSAGPLSNPVSQAVLDWTFGMGSLGAHQATVACGHAFAETDFRQDLAGIKVPALIIHGADDKIVPIKNSGDRMSQHLPHATYITYDGAPHGLLIIEKDKFNRDLIDFILGTEVRGV